MTTEKERINNNYHQVKEASKSSRVKFQMKESIKVKSS